MRQTLILLASFVSLLSCNSGNKAKVLSDSTTKQQSSFKTSKTERQILVEELKQLQEVLVSNDKEKIAGIFSFPISKDSFDIYIEDSAFNEQLEKNDNKITRAMFIHFFTDISEGLQVDQLNMLFKKLNIDDLLHKDTLKYESVIEAEPCYPFYEVMVEKDLLTLTIGSNSNDDYKSKSVSEDEIPENDSSICEHTLWWIFTFDGKQLHFKEIAGAG